MNLQKLALTAGAVLFAASAAFAATPAEQWLTHYYETPKPEQLVRQVYALSDEGYFDREDQPATAIGFFATVFAQNPQHLNDWIARLDDLPEKHQRVMAAALWYAGDHRGQMWMDRLVSDERPEVRRVVSRLESQGIATVEDTPVLSASSMRLQWGAFLASGKENYITNILAAVGEGAPIEEAARTQFAFAASEHERVREICRDQLDKQPNEVRPLLRAVLHENGSATVPRS